MYDSQALGDTMRRLYPCALMRGKRIRRDEGTHVGEFRLDSETAEFLGWENLGLIIQECGKLERICQKLRQLDQSVGDGVWIAVFDQKASLRCSYGSWREMEGIDWTAPKKIPLYWRASKVLFTTPETLDLALNEIGQHHLQTAGILVLDWQCTIHKLRGHAGMENDRPQRIVDFRAAVTHDGWAPPFLLLIDRAANSVDIESLRIAYALEAFWYVDGTTFSCKPLI